MRQVQEWDTHTLRLAPPRFRGICIVASKTPPGGGGTPRTCLQPEQGESDQKGPCGPCRLTTNLTDEPATLPSWGRSLNPPCGIPQLGPSCPPHQAWPFIIPPQPLCAQTHYCVCSVLPDSCCSENESRSVVSSSCDLMGYTVHGILQARILECIAVPSTRGLRTQGWTQASCIAGRFFTTWATRECEHLPSQSKCRMNEWINRGSELPSGGQNDRQVRMAMT